MQHLEGSGTPVLYIGHTVLKGYILLEAMLHETVKGEMSRPFTVFVNRFYYQMMTEIDCRNMLQN
jgi:hypothetical protein